MRRIGTILGVAAVLLVLVMGIYLSIPPKMVDFCGEVTAIEQQDGMTVFTLSWLDSAYTVAADAKTAVWQYRRGEERLDLTDIAVGDTIDGDFGRFARKAVAKYIAVW